MVTMSSSDEPTEQGAATRCLKDPAKNGLHLLQQSSLASDSVLPG